MSVNLELNDKTLDNFIVFIKEKCGIELTKRKAYLIESRLSGILVNSEFEDFESLYRALMHENQLLRIGSLNMRNLRLSDQIIDAITTNETLWFRDTNPWKILYNVLIPQWINMLREKKRDKIRVWSAASSTGQEIYSVAISISEYLLKNHITDISLDDFELFATDISNTVLAIAQKGIYDRITISRGLETTLREKYFTKKGEVWEINERIKNAVTFRRFNLQNEYSFFGLFDLILCRYVLIYFSDELRDDISKRLMRNLGSDSVLIIGSNEYYDVIKARYEMRYYENSPYYIKNNYQG